MLLFWGTQYHFLWIFYVHEPWCQYEDSSKCLRPAPSPQPGFNKYFILSVVIVSSVSSKFRLRYHNNYFQMFQDKRMHEIKK